MLVIDSVREMQQLGRSLRYGGHIIGFVPTMGYLHEGHLSLIRAAREECDKVVVSIFVNPAQFAPGEDFSNYPRDLERDKKLTADEGVDVVFAPTARGMYPLGFNTFVETEGELSSGLCASSRPGHFRGVTTVVSKLFNIVGADIAYLGQKDAQQAAVIKRMVKDLNMPVNIKVMPTVREGDGLAMSSRNSYLSPEERMQAVLVSRALLRAGELVSLGVRDSGSLVSEIEKILRTGKDIRIDYICVADPETLEPVSAVEKEALILVAAYVGRTRLIDNMVVTGDGRIGSLSGVGSERNKI